MANVKVELKCEGEAFPGLPPQLPNTTIHAFRKHVQPTLDRNPVWAGTMFWFVFPPRGGTPVPVQNWEAPLSAHAHPATNVVSFILQPPTMLTHSAGAAAAPGAGGSAAEARASEQIGDTYSFLLLELLRMVQTQLDKLH
jgi:hypothetical protein